MTLRYENKARGWKSGLLSAIVMTLATFSASAEQAAQASGPSADVLSIGGSITEIVVALGQQHRLKARDATSSYPADVTDLPSVGYMRALSPEGVLSVAPSLILSEEGAGPPEAIDVIRSADVAFVEVPGALSTDGILQKIAVVGDALGVQDRAGALSAQVKADMQKALDDASRPEEAKKRVLFVMSAESGRIMASGAGTVADAMIRMAGGVNAITDFEGFRQITDEAIGLAAPDVILMMARSAAPYTSDDDVFALPAIRLTPAGQSRSIVRMDGLLMLGFGPRTAEAVRRLNGALYTGEG
ncbi:heme/hemin ABC transporter substrate-binding protein [Roseovarius dicentrarchi]|uniref:heme/hemin ABC transporter substrate-binding protein n=1 Tax=Roseovarius dicentrarchi TaxID=2250573 RepID=UPI000DEBC92E|nr:ABC transporter substrate-binding protein [Roseovarius dicentrarchi]